MRGCNRKSTPKVVHGTVRKKNRWDQSEDYYYAPRSREIVIERDRPGEGYRHILRTQDIYDFIALIPEWDQLAVGLNAIVLATRGADYEGYHERGVVAVCAWTRTIRRCATESYYNDHRAVFERLSVFCEPITAYLGREARGQIGLEHFKAVYDWDSTEGYICHFTEDAVRAYQLLHILLHELGHHHDRMTTRSQHGTGRGETFAEVYALRYESLIWDQYVRKFRF